MNYDVNVEVVLRDNFDISAENIEEAISVVMQKCREKYGSACKDFAKDFSLETIGKKRTELFEEMEN